MTQLETPPLNGLIMVDWLSVNCKNKFVNFKFSPKYKIKNTGIHSRHFLCVDDVYLGKYKIASISHTPPHNSVVPRDLIQVKFDNKFLYGNLLKSRVEEFLAENNLVFKSFSRLDLCFDFNEFANGWSGQTFVNKFSKELIERKKDGEYQIRGRKGKDGRRENYLRFGSSTSDVQLYMYDKTLEIQEKKHKPYIVDTWKLNGLDISNVWRVEFKLVSFSKGFYFSDDKETVAFTMKDLDLLLEKNYKLLFKFLYYRYMFFYKTCSKKSNVSRNKRIHLITNFQTPERIEWFTLKEKDISGRTEKIILKKINEHFNEVRNLKTRAKEVLAYQWALKNYINQNIKKYDLQTWAQMKLKDFNEHDEFDLKDRRKIEKFINDKVRNITDENAA